MNQIGSGRWDEWSYYSNPVEGEIATLWWLFSITRTFDLWFVLLMDLEEISKLRMN